MPFRAAEPTRRRDLPRFPDPRRTGAAPSGRLHARLRHFDGPADVRSFLRIGVALALVPLALSTLGLQRVLARLDTARGAPRRRGSPVTAEAAVERGRRLAGYADFWLRYLRPRNPCLRRSLVLFERLRRAGLPVTFCLGICKDQPPGADEPVQGHAWLEMDGRVILEPEAAVARHLRTYRYPPPEEG